MRTKAALLSVTLVLAAVTAVTFAADKPPQSMQDMMRQHHGVSGQQTMMACPMMGMMAGGMMGGGINGATAANPRLPQLPPGNEKLQLQMHAEIMQAVGAILAKYAAQVR